MIFAENFLSLRQKDIFLTKWLSHGGRHRPAERAEIGGGKLCRNDPGAGVICLPQPGQGVGDRQSAVFQQGQGIFPPAQQMEIGRQGGKCIGSPVQCGIHGKAAHPGPGIADGGQGVQQSIIGDGGADGGFQTVLQPFGDAPHLRERRFAPASCPEKGQFTPSGSGKVRVLPGGISFLIKRQDFLRHIGGECISPALGPEQPEGAGAGKLPVAGVEGFAMVRTPPGKGMGLHPGRKAADGPAVFHGEIVVGLIQQCRCPWVGTDCSRSCLPGSGKAPCPAGQLSPQGIPVGIAVQQFSGFHQKGSVRGLGTEHKTVAPGGSEQCHPRPGKGFGSGTGMGGGQGKDKVSPAGQRRPGADSLRQKRQRSPLHQSAAHGDGDALCAHGPGLPQLPGVAVVEGVVFGNDTGKFHGVSSKVCEISVRVTGEPGLKDWILGRMYKKVGDIMTGFAAIAD